MEFDNEIFNKNYAPLNDTMPQEVNFGTVAANVDQVMTQKYPQLSKLIKFPNRESQMKLYQKVHEKIVKRAQHRNEKALLKPEEDASKQFFDESAKIGKENMKTFLLLNQQRVHNIPDDVKKSLIAFKMYYDIPIIDGRLMAPYANSSNWKNGKLQTLTPKKLRDYVKIRINNLGNEKELRKYPEYRLLLGYIKGPTYFNKIRSIISKDEAAYKNPNKMANRIIKHFDNNNFSLNATATPQRYVKAGDLANLSYLNSTLTSNKFNTFKDKTEKIKPFIDTYINGGDLKSDTLTDYYRKFAPPYAPLLNKNL
jgi:hypothetical protein